MVSTTTITFMAWLAFDCFSLHINDVNIEDDYDDDGNDTDDNDDGGEYKDRDDDSYEK